MPKLENRPPLRRSSKAWRRDRAADAVEDDVDRAGLRRPAGLRVVDGVVGAEAARELGLALAARRRDDARAGAGRELHEQAADAAGRGLDEDGLAGLDLRRLEEHERRAAVGEQRDGVGELEAVGDLDEQVRVGERALRVAAAPAGRRDDAPADAAPGRRRRRSRRRCRRRRCRARPAAPGAIAGCGGRPARSCVSTNVTLASSTSTTTSPGPGCGSCTVLGRRCSGGPNACRTAAFTAG